MNPWQIALLIYASLTVGCGIGYFLAALMAMGRGE